MSTRNETNQNENIPEGKQGMTWLQMIIGLAVLGTILRYAGPVVCEKGSKVCYYGKLYYSAMDDDLRNGRMSLPSVKAVDKMLSPRPGR